MIGEAFDKLVGVFSPQRGLSRTLARQTMAQVRSYDAGKTNRLNRNRIVGSESGNSPNLVEVQNSRYRAWEMFRNDAICRKAVRTVIAQTVGCGMRYEPAETNRDGKRDDAFNRQSREAFSAWSKRVTPDAICAGGYGFGWMQALALQELILSGEFLVRFVRLSEAEAKRLGFAIPVALQFIEGERLVEDATGLGRTARNVFRGIEYDDNDRRVAYHVYRQHPADPRISSLKLEIEPIPADEVLHVFLPDRIGQQRGVSWMAANLNILRDTADYRQTEMTAAAVAACVSLWIEQSGGSSPTLNTNSNREAVDLDGNRITTLQPGMIARVRPGEKINGFSPMRPNTNAVDFINHLLRHAAGGLPGVKSSTLTGDYRQASFSSERAADNDAWRETEIIQDFFAAYFCQPIYERVMETAWLMGAIGDGRKGKPTFACVWHGPVARSIQPDTDARAASLSVSNATSSPQLEAAGTGTDWKQNIAETAEVYQFAKSQGLPEVVCLRMAGIDNAQPQAEPEADESDDEPTEGERLSALIGKPGGVALMTNPFNGRGH